MKLFKTPFLYLIFVLSLLVVVILFFMINNPAKRTLEEFLSSVNESSKIPIQNFVVPENLDDPFITILMNQNIIKNHRIINVQRLDKIVEKSKPPLPLSMALLMYGLALPNI